MQHDSSAPERDDPPERPPPELATCSWRAYRPQMGVPVRISRGLPRWFVHEHEHIPQLAPPRKVLAIADENWREFCKKYRHHLYRVTAERLRAILEEISERRDGARLVLLCYEPDPADCHRGEFSRWWFQQTGEHIEEYAAQPALFDDLPREEER